MMNGDEDSSKTKWLILSAVLLIIVCVAGYLFYEYKYLPVEIQNNLSFGASVCSKISGTPAWASQNGSIIGVGYIPFGNNSKVVVKDNLIPNNIYFIYSPGCGYCALQVQEFGESWEDYVRSGLTIDCLQVYEQIKDQK